MKLGILGHCGGIANTYKELSSKSNDIDSFTINTLKLGKNSPSRSINHVHFELTEVANDVYANK